MSTFLTSAPLIIRSGLGNVDTSELIPLGTRVVDNEGNVYIYLKGVALTAIGSWVAYDEDFQTSLLTETVAAKLYPVALATVASVASTYAWYMIAGKEYQGLVKASCSKEALLYATTTAGSLDDAGTTTIHGVVATTTVTDAGLTDVILNYPFPSAA